MRGGAVVPWVDGNEDEVVEARADEGEGRYAVPLVPRVNPEPHHHCVVGRPELHEIVLLRTAERENRNRDDQPAQHERRLQAFVLKERGKHRSTARPHAACRPPPATHKAHI
eukprot:3934970-Rhodomonas_salina.3